MANLLDRIRSGRSDLDRGIAEVLRYYGGPLGGKLSSAVQVADMFNPVSGVEASMAAAGRAAESDRSALERIQSILESGTEAALALTPAAAAKLLMRGTRTAARAADEAASGVTETLTGARVPGVEEDDWLEGIEAALAEDDLLDEVVAAARAEAPGYEQMADEDWAEFNRLEEDYERNVLDGGGDPYEQTPFDPDDFDPDDFDVDYDWEEVSREEIVAAFGGPDAFARALRDPFTGAAPADPDQAARNLSEVPVLNETYLDPEYGPEPNIYTVRDILNMRPDDVRSLMAEPMTEVLEPDLANLLADMPLPRFAGVTGLPEQSLRGGLGGGDTPPAFDIDEDANELFLNNFVGPATPAQALTFPEPSMAEPARFYSPTARAASQLPQSMYGSLDEGIAALQSRGAKPEELRMLEQYLYERTELGPEASLRIMRDTMEQAAGDALDLGISQPRPVYLTGNETGYDSYFTPGGTAYQEVVLEAPELLKAAFPDEAFQHFRPSTGGVLSHYRSAIFPTSEPGVADAYHVGEVQSDLAQIRNKLFPTAEDEARFKAQRDAKLGPLGDELSRLMARRIAMETEIRNRASQGYSLDSPEMDSLTNTYSNLLVELNRVADEHAALAVTRSDDALRSRFGSRADFDREYSSKIPAIGSTDKWVQMTLRQALVDAANSPARYLTLGTGEMAAAMTGGKEAGQSVFYDEILPKNLNKILKRLAREAKIQVPRIEPREIQTEQGPKLVPSIQLTDELRQALAEVGVPTYRDGGLVDTQPFS